MRLKNKVAIITGGASGIGQAICEVFAEEGARLAVADIDAHGGQKTVSAITAAGGEALFIQADVSKEAEVEAMVAQTAAAYGAVNILVNDAAAFEFGKVEDITDEQWKRVFGVNVLGQAYCVKHVLPHMRSAGGGAIVNIASVSGFIAQPAFVPYNASKGAVMQLTRCLALDLAPDNIRVNCVCPGAILTPATERHRQFEGRDREEFLAEAASGSFMKRVGDPREVAYGALFLASDEASFVTGTPLVIDGGATAQ